MVVVKEIIRSYYSCSEDVKLDIDSAISDLYDKGVLSDIEVQVVSATKEQYSLALIGELLGIDKTSAGRLLSRACKKLSKFLGPEYQEVKVIEAAEKRLKRPLTKEEKSFCLRKMRDFGRNRYASLNIFNFNEHRRDKEQG